MPLLNELSASELLALTRTGHATVTAVAEAVIARVEARQPDVRAYVHFDKRQILNQAAALDAEPVKGPLHGVPVAVKDVFNTRDMPTGHNSARYDGCLPGIDAACVDTLRAAGALIIGKTVTTEFAATLRGGETRNPLDLTRTPGGSSSGSAAAVADFQATIALGTQTGGSTIRPASFNGIYAAKPTWSAISREGFKMGTISADTVGLYARSAEDLALLAEIFDLEPEEEPLPGALDGLRIAVCRTPAWSKAEPAAVRALEAGALTLGKCGAAISELVLPEEFAGFADAQMKIGRREGRSTFLNEYRNTPDLHDEFKARVENRDSLSPQAVRLAYRTVERCRAVFDDIAQHYDAILTPSAPGVAPVGLDVTGDASFNSMWTLLQVPVVNVPGFRGDFDMPVGLSLVGRRYDDRKVIAIAGLAGRLFG